MFAVLSQRLPPLNAANVGLLFVVEVMYFLGNSHTPSQKSTMKFEGNKPIFSLRKI